MLKKIRKEEPQEDSSTAELDALQHTDWVKDVLNRAVAETVYSYLLIFETLDHKNKSQFFLNWDS